MLGLCFMPWAKVVLTPRLVTRYKKKNGGTVHCHRCPETFEEGDVLWSHTSRALDPDKTSTLRLYCESCYSALWF